MNLPLYFHTIRNLKWPQIHYRLPVLRNFGRQVSKEELNKQQAGQITGWTPSVPSVDLWQGGLAFRFLNQTHIFSNEVGWDFAGHGLLWAYNLNYFEFLVQENMDSDLGFKLIDRFLERYEQLKIAHDPYPISLRLIFWIRFFIRQNNPPDFKYLLALHGQAKELQSKLEFHILGNHLLENAFALYISGCYLSDGSLLYKGSQLLRTQLKEQVLPDGGHFELSPMYHQLMLYRLLDAINVGRSCPAVKGKAILPLLEHTASKMLAWMENMCFSDGSFPLFNDAANGIAPMPVALAAYARRMGIVQDACALKESGYRKWADVDWEMFIDAGRPGPKYQPGHAHCDALSFVLNIKGYPVFVDTGTSIYGGNSKIRLAEKSTAAHNTVQVDELEQSEIWGDFRMARQAGVRIISETQSRLDAAHNGFRFSKTEHRRIFEKKQNAILITDLVNDNGTARFHFHPGINIEFIDNNKVSFGHGMIEFEGNCRINGFDYKFAPHFGVRVPAKGLAVTFERELASKVSFSVE
ncbi:MAG TPA: alginate lyase family protein [Edaphocola sp.]|nr:alginate lyase family protein [Edaphocola sp.]